MDRKWRGIQQANKEELSEEEFIGRCFQEIQEKEEEHEWLVPPQELPLTVGQTQDQFNDHVTRDDSSLEDPVVKRSLNPSAQEFVPGVKY